MIGVDDAARLLGVHRNTIHTMLRDGRLKAVTEKPAYMRRPRKIEISRADVLALLGEVEPAEDAPPKHAAS